MKRQVEAQFLRPAQIVAERKKTSLVYQPVGPIEWHGPHLPLGVDPLRARLAALHLAQELGGIVMPTLFMGTERERPPQMLDSLGFPQDAYVVGMDFPRNQLKSLYTREEVFAIVLREHLESLIRGWGFRKVVIVNGHGAENHLNVIERLRRELIESTGAKIICVMPMLNYPDHGWGHAAKEETETLLPFYPESVDLSRLPAAGTPLANTRWAIIDDRTFRGKPVPDRTVRPEEDPRDAEAEKGRAVFARTMRGLEKLIHRELAR